MCPVSGRVVAPWKRRFATVVICSLLSGGCATLKESDTSRTGVEKPLISSAVDRSLR